MTRTSVVLFFGCTAVCLGQAKTDPFEVRQVSAEYSLKGLSSVQVCPLTAQDDMIKRFSLGAVSLEEMRAELSNVLKRYHIPISVSSAACVNKDDTGTIALLSRTIGNPGDVATVFTLELRVSEPVILKRDPLRKALTIDWDDEQDIDSPSSNAKDRFREAIRELGERFALAYLAANK